MSDEIGLSIAAIGRQLVILSGAKNLRLFLFTCSPNQ